MPNLRPLIIGFPGHEMTDFLRRHLLDCRPAGVALFQRNIVSLEQTKSLIKSIQEVTGPILISIDHEGGAVQRFADLAPVPPSAFALGQTGRIDLVQRAARQLAGLLGELGINMNFAPVADLYSSQSPVIHNRAFSAHPEEVARYAKAQVEEHLKLGIIPVIKHFPGHGRSMQDSHFSSGVAPYSKNNLTQLDLKPFQQLIQAGAPAFMTAHLHYPALDNHLPASLSKKILTDLLRREMNFQGVVISDCLEMSATAGHFNPKEMAKLGVEAGLDLFLSSYSLIKSLEFQQQLALSLDQHPNPARDQRISKLIEQAQRPCPQLPTWEGNHQLWEETISLPNISINSQNIHLYEFKEPTNQGINAGQKPHPLMEKLTNSPLRITQSQSISDLSTLKEAVTKANQDQACLILISGAKISNPIALKELKNAKESLHLSLNHPQNLDGSALWEASLAGYNASGGFFITKMLERLCQSR